MKLRKLLNIYKKFTEDCFSLDNCVMVCIWF